MLYKLLERLTGARFPRPLDPREWECKPLRVIREDGVVVFHDNVTVGFTPDGEDQGWAEVMVDHPPPSIHVNRHEGVWGPPSVYLGDPFLAGLALIGKDMGGLEYVWLINRAYEFAQVDTLWSNIVPVPDTLVDGAG